MCHTVQWGWEPVGGIGDVSVWKRTCFVGEETCWWERRRVGGRCAGGNNSQNIIKNKKYSRHT